MLDGMTNIKASEVLKEIKYYTEDLPPYSPDEVAEGLEMAIKALEQRWIPVSERLPEDGRPVLIYAWNVHHVIARYDTFRTDDGYKKTWVTADAWNGNTEIGQEVMAWMPLPEPFKAAMESEADDSN